MMPDEERIARAWLEAAKDLGIRVRSPFVLEAGDREFRFIALVEDFGSRKGTLICLPSQWDDLGFADAAEEYGFYCSGLYPQSYSEYDRREFIETLEDWGWAGGETAEPDWYKKSA